MQHNGSCVSSGSVADEVPNPDLLQREPESVNVGTLAERRIASAYCATVRSESLIDTGNSGEDRRNTAGTATSSRPALTLAEREEISRSLVAGDSIRLVASRLGRAPSTISREIGRNGGSRGYRANRADALAWDRALRPKECKLVRNRELARVVASKLQLQWSPEQIAGWLKHSYAVNKDHEVSHETIYRSLYIQARGALKKELLEHLRRTRAMRRSRHHTMKTDDHGRICDAVSISERPATAEDRAIPGHWEGDLLFGNANSQIATLVERQTRYVMLVRVASKDAETVVNAAATRASAAWHRSGTHPKTNSQIQQTTC